MRIFLLLLIGIIAGQADAALAARQNVPQAYKKYLGGIGYLRSPQGYCTAFCISRDVIATAEHCLRTKKQRWRSPGLNHRFVIRRGEAQHEAQIDGKSTLDRSINIAYGVKKVGPFFSVASKKKLLLEADWALIKLSKDICDISLPMGSYVGLASRTNRNNTSAALVSVPPAAMRTGRLRWEFSGPCRFMSPPMTLGEDMLAHDCHSVPGMSGAPIFLRERQKEPIVVALNSGYLKIKPKTGKEFKLRTAISLMAFTDSIQHFRAHKRFSDSTRIAEVQRQLKRLGHLDGKIDGKFGPQTRLAIALFEHSVGLPEVGLPSDLIYDLLTGARTMPNACYRFRRKNVVPEKCRRFGLSDEIRP